MRYFSRELLWRLRNQIDFSGLFHRLNWPHKRREGQLAFLCPHCRETDSDVNPRTNLARCFQCQTNFNPIDFTIAVRECDFVEAVQYLTPFLPVPGRDLSD
jgi:hypothetical protein